MNGRRCGGADGQPADTRGLDQRRSCQRGLKFSVSPLSHVFPADHGRPTVPTWSSTCAAVVGAGCPADVGPGGSSPATE